MPETCPRCDGEGFIVVCCDDLCHSGSGCIHGDGDVVCPECHGECEVPVDGDLIGDDFDDGDDCPIVAPTPGSGRWPRRFQWSHAAPSIWVCRDPLTSLVAIVRRRKRGVDWQVKRVDYDQDTVVETGAAHSITAAKRCALRSLENFAFAGGADRQLEEPPCSP